MFQLEAENKTYDHALIIGLGISGFSTARYLRGQGLSVAVSERRPAAEFDADTLSELERLDIAFEDNGHTDAYLKPGCLVIPGQNVALDRPIIRKGIEQGCRIVGELGLAAGRFQCPVIAITGTNGKTTVTSLTGDLLKAAGKQVFVGGNIGIPLLEGLMDGKHYDAVVLEISSFQAEIAGRFRPDIGVFLNLSPDHLDRHSDMNTYLAAKLALFQHQTANDIRILPSDDAILEKQPPGGAAKPYTFGLDQSADFRITDSGVHAFPQQHHYDLSSTKLNSPVNRLNSGAAIAAASLAGCSPENIQQGLGQYRLQPHRMEKVARHRDVSWIDDSKATNIGAVQAALDSCRDPVILIAGGRNKNSDFSLLAPAVRRRVSRLILLGEAKTHIAEALSGACPIHMVEAMDAAVRLAARLAQAGDTVLLAPGCTSFDMFTDYAHRGRVFQQHVRQVVAEHVSVSRQD
uniref:UDP-N-acetylmuramoylalanine--D-glutamate ligase n=1 Tax=Candidatus Kentrum sp. LPFa TaxID=2126335 RepID=A0A450W4E6_9GAMM|nr:MAG: UDP-N-acetylmuramoylalanine--D-glutamate ligase [Candidatus Kentron sp. LPFa]